MSSLPTALTITRSAFRAGSLANVLLRYSSHSQSGLVLVAVFRDHTRAGSFARRWSIRLGLGVAVRRHPAGWAVSVPVHRRHTKLGPAVNRLFAVKGGVAKFHQLTFRSGLTIA